MAASRLQNTEIGKSHLKEASIANGFDSETTREIVRTIEEQSVWSLSV